MIVKNNLNILPQPLCAICFYFFFSVNFCFTNKDKNNSLKRKKIHIVLVVSTSMDTGMSKIKQQYNDKHHRKLEILHLFLFIFQDTQSYTRARSCMQTHANKHLNIYFLLLLLYHSQQQRINALVITSFFLLLFISFIHMQTNFYHQLIGVKLR